MKNKFIFWVLCIVLLSSFVLARPPHESLDTGLRIQTVKTETHLLNTEYYLHAHVYDTETGVIISNDPLLTCYYHVYAQNANWEHIDIGTLDNFGAGVQTYINETVFNETGEYTILLWCDYDNLKGGFDQSSFLVYDETVYNLTTTNHFIFIIIIISFVMLGLFLSSWFGLIGSLGLLFYSFNLFAISIPLAILVLGSSLLLVIGFSMKEF